MQLIQVNDKNSASQFLQVAVDLYKNDPQWIRPLDKDINEVFDKNKNKAFRFGEAARWVLKTDDGKLIGRIAAFTNKKYKNKGDDVAVGGMGFFECINNRQAADLLFDTAKNWLQEKGMEAMDGPINFGERDKWWGLVTDGFTEPLYCMNYNPPYYLTLFEQYGFKVFFNQICFGIDPQKPIAQKIFERHAALAADPDFTGKLIDKNQLPKFAADFTTVYNKAWAGHGGLKQLAVEQVMIMFKKMKPVIDERIIYYAYYKDEPVGMFLNLPDLNQYFRHMNGKFGLLQKLYFVYLQKMKPSKKFTGLVFGVVPEWQGRGVDAFLIGECQKQIQVLSKPYLAYEMQWIGDFNPKMINVAENFGETFRSRNLATYRYLFNREKEFKRHPILI
jgi:GNAT superfamily N-acetyltransferase